MDGKYFESEKHSIEKHPLPIIDADEMNRVLPLRYVRVSLREMR